MTIINLNIDKNRAGVEEVEVYLELKYSTARAHLFTDGIDDIWLPKSQIKIEHVKKNDKSNLVVLCKTHHIAVHNKDLEIYGYKETNDGLLLDYKQIDKKEYENKKKSRLKYTEDDIKIIEKYRGKPISFTLNKLEKCHQIKISKTTLNKIFNGTYGN